MDLSPLQIARYEYQPKLPLMLRNAISEIEAVEGANTESAADQDKIKALFPNTYGLKEVSFQKGTSKASSKKQVVGVILSGGQAPGGHNVVCGLYDALKASSKDNELIGFLGGPSGLTDDKTLLITDEYINKFRNTGGFDIIGSGRTKLESVEQFDKAAKVCAKHGVTAVVIIGGDDSNTNAAVLAEYFKANNTGVQVIGSCNAPRDRGPAGRQGEGKDDRHRIASHELPEQVRESQGGEGCLKGIQSPACSLRRSAS